MRTPQDASTRDHTDTEDYLTVPEAARLLRVARSTVYRHAAALGAVRAGKALRIPRAALTRSAS